jgi:hypothetical protein
LENWPRVIHPEEIVLSVSAFMHSNKQYTHPMGIMWFLMEISGNISYRKILFDHIK